MIKFLIITLPLIFLVGEKEIQKAKPLHSVNPTLIMGDFLIPEIVVISNQISAWCVAYKSVSYKKHVVLFLVF